MIKYILIFLFGFFLSLFVFVQESLLPISFVNIMAFFQTKPENISWNVGIFAIIGAAITIIGILLTIRFIYIDKIYEKKINSLNDNMLQELEEQEKSLQNNSLKLDDISLFADYVYSISSALENTRMQRKANNHNGLILDIVCICFLLIIGVIMTTGTVADHFYFLIVFVVIVTLLPIVHFASKLSKSTNKINRNHLWRL